MYLSTSDTPGRRAASVFPRQTHISRAGSTVGTAFSNDRTGNTKALDVKQWRRRLADGLGRNPLTVARERAGCGLKGVAIEMAPRVHDGSLTRNKKMTQKTSILEENNHVS